MESGHRSVAAADPSPYLQGLRIYSIRSRRRDSVLVCTTLVTSQVGHGVKGRYSFVSQPPLKLQAAVSERRQVDILRNNSLLVE